LQRVTGGKVVLVPLLGGPATIKEDNAWMPRNVRIDGFRA
jgi:hypothetical protein